MADFRSAPWWAKSIVLLLFLVWPFCAEIILLDQPLDRFFNYTVTINTVGSVICVASSGVFFYLFFRSRFVLQWLPSQNELCKSDQWQFSVRDMILTISVIALSFIGMRTPWLGLISIPVTLAGAWAVLVQHRIWLRSCLNNSTL